MKEKKQTDTLQWRHNDHDGVSNHQPHGCLLNSLFWRRSKKTSKLRVTGLCAGNSPGPVNSPHKGPLTRLMFPFDDVIMQTARQMITHIVGKWQRSKVSLFEFQFVNSTISTSVNQYTSKVSHTMSCFSMMTSSHGNIFRVTGHLCGEFPGPGEFPTNKGQWRGALMFSLICVWINGWVNNREAGDMRRYRAHYDVTVMLHLIVTVPSSRKLLNWSS